MRRGSLSILPNEAVIKKEFTKGQKDSFEFRLHVSFTYGCYVLRGKIGNVSFYQNE